MIRLQLITLWNMLQARLGREDGQDLVEYALLVALIALAATAGMNSLASDINSAFTNVGSLLNSDI